MAFATRRGAVVGFLVAQDALPMERTHIRRLSRRGFQRMAVDARCAFARIVALNLSITGAMMTFRTIVNAGSFIMRIVIEHHWRPGGLDGFWTFDLQHLGPCDARGEQHRRERRAALPQYP